MTTQVANLVPACLKPLTALANAKDRWPFPSKPLQETCTRYYFCTSLLLIIRTRFADRTVRIAATETF